MRNDEYRLGLHELGAGCHAYLQPDGGWGWSNAGLIVGDHGTGKTTIMRRLTSLMRADARFRIAVIETAEHCPSLFQLVKEILESFGKECVGTPRPEWINSSSSSSPASRSSKPACSSSMKRSR